MVLCFVGAVVFVLFLDVGFNLGGGCLYWVCVVWNDVLVIGAV